MKPIKTIPVVSVLITIYIENLSQLSSLLMKLYQSRNIRATIRGAAIRRFLTSRCKVEMLLRLKVSSIRFKTFRRLPEYTSNVWTPTLEIYCKAILLRSRNSAISRTVKRRPVSITSLTSVNVLSSVRVRLPTL